MKCDVLGNVHSMPISDIDFDVEINSSLDCISRCLMNQRWGGMKKWRLNYFLNDVSYLLHIVANSSIARSLNIFEYIICSKLSLAESTLLNTLLFRQQSLCEMIR